MSEELQKAQDETPAPRKPFWKRRFFVVPVSIVAAILVLGCLVNLIYRPVSVSTGGKLVFEDTFDRAEVGDLYFQGVPDRGNSAGEWRIVDGQLKAEKIHNAALWLQKELPEKVRVEFDVRPLSEDGDAKCEIFGDGKTHQSGYIVINGGWHNTVNCIARQDEHGEDRKNDNRCPMRGQRKMCVEPDVDYHWAVERTSDTVRWFLDGQLFLTFHDKNPVMGRYFAFNNWEAPVLFDNLRIYDLAQ